MASFFGEVIYSSSRACDEEEELFERFVVEVSINENNKENLKNSNVCIISYGALTSDFCNAVLQPSKSSVIGTVRVERISDVGIDTGDFHKNPTQITNIYSLPGNVSIICFNYNIVPSTVNEISKKILSCINKSCTILTLTSNHYGKLMERYETEDGSHCIVYSLKTDEFPKTSCIYPSLPQPSTLDGLPAALLTRSILEKRPCIVYSTYSETYCTGDLFLVVDNLKKIFDALPFKDIKLNLEKETIKKFNSAQARSANLDRYM